MVKEKDDREYSLEERLKSYFDRKSKVGKLDSALLFLSSSTGLVFTVVQVTTSVSRIAFFLPIVLLGWGLPFYYGYLLGGVVRDSAIDRLRGWIFFIAGLGGYSWMLATLWLNQTFQTGPLSPYFPALISLPILIVIALRKDRFRDFIFETVGQDYTTISSKAAK